MPSLRTPLSGFLAHILPPSIDSSWLGFRAHSSPGAIQSLPFPLRGLHPLASKRSSVQSECSAAYRFRDSCPTRLSSRSGLQPSFPARPICCLHLSATECLTSLADDMTYYTLC